MKESFADRAKKIVKGYKGYEDDPLAKEAMHRELKALAKEQETVKKKIGQETGAAMENVNYAMLKYGGCIRKAMGGKVEVDPAYKARFTQGAKEFGMSEADFLTALDKEMLGFQNASQNRIGYLQDQYSSFKYGGATKKMSGGGPFKTRSMNEFTEDYFNTQPVNTPSGPYYPEIGDGKLVADAQDPFKNLSQPSFTQFIKDTDPNIAARTADSEKYNKSTKDEEVSSDTKSIEELSKEGQQLWDKDYSKLGTLAATMAGDLYQIGEGIKGYNKLKLESPEYAKVNPAKGKLAARIAGNQQANLAITQIARNAQTAGQLISGTTGVVGRTTEASARVQMDADLKAEMANVQIENRERDARSIVRNQETQYNEQMEIERRRMINNAIASMGTKAGQYGSDRSKFVQDYIDRMIWQDALKEGYPLAKPVYETNG